jgi:hypothetical protein
MWFMVLSDPNGTDINGSRRGSRNLRLAQATALRPVEDELLTAARNLSTERVEAMRAAGTLSRRDERRYVRAGVISSL